MTGTGTWWSIQQVEYGTVPPHGKPSRSWMLEGSNPADTFGGFETELEAAKFLVARLENDQAFELLKTQHERNRNG